MFNKKRKFYLYISIYKIDFILIDNHENNECVNLEKFEIIKSEYPSFIVNNLLNAIRFNSYEARQRFPRLLQIVEVYSEKTLQIFVDQVK